MGPAPLALAASTPPGLVIAASGLAIIGIAKLLQDDDSKSSDEPARSDSSSREREIQNIKSQVKKQCETAFYKGLQQGKNKRGPSEQEIQAKYKATYYKRLLQQQKQMNEELKKLQKQKEKAKTPSEAAQVIQNMKQSIWTSMKSMNFPKNVNNRKNVIFIGQTSVGKSSLINALFGTKCKTSKGRCTKGIIAVAQFKDKVRIFDCQGFSDDFDMTANPDIIPNYLGVMDVIYYLYDDPKKDIVKTCLSLQKEFYAVRTKCDPDQSPEENPKLRAHDSETFKSMGVKNPKIFLVSKHGGEDNSRLLQHILNVPK